MSSKFYEVAGKLDILKKITDIKSDDLNELSTYLQEDKYAAYFFNDLDNPFWVIPLHKNGLILKIPPPLESPDNKGYFSMPIWFAGEYLKRMAGQFPEIVKNEALSLNTDNSRAIRTMLEALLKIPADVTAETVVVFNRWSESPYANFMVISHEMGLILEYLSKNNQVDAALIVLDVLLEPVKTKERANEEIIIAGSRHDFYWLNKACQENLPFLTEIDPIRVVEIAERQLIKAIGLEYDPKFDEIKKRLNSYWRLSISPQSELNYDRDFKNLLVNTIISALNKAYEQKKEEFSKLITRYIESEYSIFTRIAVYMLRNLGKQYPELLKKAYLRFVKEPIPAGQYEFQKLIDIQFSNLPEFAQKDVLEKINEGPEPEWIDGLLGNPDRIDGKTIVDKRQTMVEKWQLSELDRINIYLDGKEKELYNTLLKKYDKPLPRPEEGVVITSWEGPESPIELEELGKKTINDAVQFLLSYVPQSKDSFGEPSREGLGRILENDIQNRESDYANNALLFINNSLSFVYHTYLLRGLEAAVKNQKRFNLANVISVCEYITTQEKDEFDKQEHEEGLPAAKLAVVNFFEELLKITETFIEDDLLERTGQIILKLFTQVDPFLADEANSGFDPAMRSLNSIHGMAMHCIVRYGLYCERKRKKENGGKGEPVMVPFVKETLTAKLDKAKNPSPTIHSVFGWYFPQFIYLDKAWALENRERIFLGDPEMVIYWQAAWSAYIQFSDVYTNVFPELTKQYKRALEELPSMKSRQGLERIDEKMATHILKAYLLDMIKMDSEDGLISSYYQVANDETRSHGNFWLSQALEAQKPSKQDAVWKKIWSLWQWRIKEATTSKDRNNFTKEISNFCRLLKNVPVELSEMYLILKQTLRFISKGYEVGLIINYLGENSEKYPNLAVSLLYEIILSDQSFFLIDTTKISIRKIITSIPHADLESRKRAIEIINIFGERGDYEWRPLLDGLGE
jgi:hypothetical protein